MSWCVIWRTPRSSWRCTSALGSIPSCRSAMRPAFRPLGAPRPDQLACLAVPARGERLLQGGQDLIPARRMNARSGSSPGPWQRRCRRPTFLASLTFRTLNILSQVRFQKQGPMLQEDRVPPRLRAPGYLLASHQDVVDRRELRLDAEARQRRNDVAADLPDRRR